MLSTCSSTATDGILEDKEDLGVDGEGSRIN